MIVWIDRLHGGKMMIVCFSVKPPLEEGATDVVDFFVNSDASDNGLGNDVRVGQSK